MTLYNVVEALGWLIFVWFYSLWIRQDHREARWLPWWRRYMPTGLITCAVAWHYAVGPGFWRNPFWWAAVVVGVWNSLTARRNKRDGKDQKKLEEEAPRLTEVQERSFRQQVAEARA